MIRNVFIIALFALVTLSGCVQQPTRSEQTVDMRPAISFTPKSESHIATGYSVYVDNLEMGNAAEFITGKSALRVLSGTHLIELKHEGDTVLSTKVFLGDGAVKSFILP